MLQALRVRDFRLLWGGGLVSDLGTWLLTIAIPAHVYLATGSIRATGLLVAAEYAPALVLGPAAGVLADRADRRRLMIGANLLCAGSVATMLAGLAAGRFWVLFVALIAENSGVVLGAPALQARIPEVVGTGPTLTAANSLESVSDGVVRLAGGPLGAVLLLAVGVRWLICVDAASYVAAAVAVWMTAAPRAAAPGGGHGIGAAARDIAAGMSVLRGERAVRTLLLVVMIFLAANAALSALFIPLAVGRLGGSTSAGSLLTCLGIGFLAGAPVIRLLLDRVRPAPLLAACLAVTAAAFLALFTSSTLATALPAAVAIGMFGSVSLVIPRVTTQRIIRGEVLGRVSAAFLAGGAAATLAGAIAGPVLAEATGFTVVAAGASVVTLGAAALAFLVVPRSPLATAPSPGQGSEVRDIS